MPERIKVPKDAQLTQSLASYLGNQYDQVMLVDRAQLEKDWAYLQKRRARGQPFDRVLQKIHNQWSQALERVEQRRLSCPELSFPEHLPVAQKVDEIASLMQQHPVVILAGETGSGKTTQIPKICLSLGRGIRGVIGHTQPRRIAARTVASRIAEELGVTLGSAVGYQVRFSDQTQANTHIKLMTDGILLAEIQYDPLLLRYDTLIIDEAHERSLNIDFLLGYLKKILPQRPDLKIIITSATIDLERFSKHFDKAPVLEVSGRTYPVTVHYHPCEDDNNSQADNIVAAIDHILTSSKDRGDILVFLSGERDIRETALAIRKAEFKHLSVLPLYARLSLAEQNKVFQDHRGRRVVLATNVAETSITVPGIRYVIDPGYARLSRYSVRTKVQRLPIEPISQASANQRKGRCGRVSDGVCVRLYSEEDFATRPEFTDPEILRTNLASVVLQMLHLRMGDIHYFPFVDRPDNRLIRDGFKLLEELQAINSKGQLNDLGRQLVALPLDPRLARMVIEAQQQNCLREILIIVSALTVQDVRERPADKRQAADEKHRRFWHEQSDFMTFVNLWMYAEEQRQNLSQNQWCKQCAREFLSFLRLREWRELHHQLRTATKTLGMHENREPASYEAIHRALLSGLLGNIGQKHTDKNQHHYNASRQRAFHIFPGSSQFKKRWPWLIAGELLETSKLYAHNVARIEPEWVLQAAPHLIKTQYNEPHYHKKSGQVMAYASISLYGLVLVEKRRLPYSHIDKKIAREIFIRAALVEGQYTGKGKFFEANTRCIKQVVDMENKTRRRDILVDDEIIHRFYDERIPETVVNLAGFEKWRKDLENKDPRCLFIEQSYLMQRHPEEVTQIQFPDTWTWDGVTLSLRYSFEPKHEDDGVSLEVPVGLLHWLPQHCLDWLVPGLLREKCIALVKALPKQWRKQFVPVPQSIDQILPRMAMENRALTDVLAEQLRRISSVQIPPEAWQGLEIDQYYFMNIHVLDEQGKLLDRGRHLEELRERFRDSVRESVQAASVDVEREGIVRWDFTEFPETCVLERAGATVRAYPALVDKQQSVDLRVFDNPIEARYINRYGMIRLLLLNFGQTAKYMRTHLLKGKDIGLSVANIGNRNRVVEDIMLTATAQVCLAEGTLPTKTLEFEEAIAKGRANVVAVAEDIEQQLLQLIDVLIAIKKKLADYKHQLTMVFTLGDIKKQLEKLIYPGFLLNTPDPWRLHYLRYLKAVEVRLEKAPMAVRKDQMMIAELEPFYERHKERFLREGIHQYADNEAWQTYRWMLEEWRVSLFAQTLKTSLPVSSKRLEKQWQESLR